MGSAGGEAGLLSFLPSFLPFPSKVKHGFTNSLFHNLDEAARFNWTQPFGIGTCR